MQREVVVRKPSMSFILRVWEGDGPAPPLRGELENLGTGERRLFLDYLSLLRLIEGWQRDVEGAE